MAKKTLEEEINSFFHDWNFEQMDEFLRLVRPLTELFPDNEDDDWIREAVDENDLQVVRMVRMVYLVSRLAEFHAGKLCTIKIRFKDLWRRLEQEGMVETNEKKIA